MNVKGIRVADLLVERGTCHSRDEAERWILAGRVYVDGQRITKAGTAVSRTAVLDVKHQDKYVSRGGVKLERALAEFGLDVRGKVALDAGASVGGFTDCLLQHGAARVYAVDVGFGQIRGKLTADPRVVTLERTNISDLQRETLQPPIDICTADLSYLSLVTALPVLSRLFEKPPVIVALIKPLFEGVRQEQKADLLAIERAVKALRDKLAAERLYVHALTDSPILGTAGSVEFLMSITDRPNGRDFDHQLTRALARASALIDSPEGPPTGRRGPGTIRGRRSRP